MSETTTTLITAAIVVPLVMFLIFLALRNLIASFRNVRDTVSPAASSATAPPTRQSASPASSDLAAKMAREFQAQANASDDAHKAQIRAHAKRKVPPITDEGREIVKRGRQAALAIKHVFPPTVPQRRMSYFGGLPIVPEDFEWPTVHNRKGLLERLTFMAQIDCSDLPPGPARDLFPDCGYLYFFAPMSLTFGPDAMHFVTRYEPRKATRNGRRSICRSPAKSSRTSRWTSSGGASARTTTASRSRSRGSRSPATMTWLREPRRVTVSSSRRRSATNG